MTSMRYVVSAVLLTLLLATGGAAASSPTRAADPQIADGSLQRGLDAARRSWKAAGLRSYRYEIRRGCYCPPQESVSVVVRGGRLVRFPQGLSSVATVPRMFRVIQGAIDEGVFSLAVRYGRRGVPRFVRIDRDQRLADEEVADTVTRFAPLR